MRFLKIGDTVQATNYAAGEKWLQGTVVNSCGEMLYDIKLPNGNIIKRHIDQLISSPTDCDNSCVNPAITPNPPHFDVLDTPPPVLPSSIVHSEQPSHLTDSQQNSEHQVGNEQPSAAQPVGQRGGQPPPLRRSTRIINKPRRLIEQ